MELPLGESKRVNPIHSINNYFIAFLWVQEVPYLLDS